MLALPAGAFGQTEAPPAQLPAQTQIPRRASAEPDAAQTEPSRPRRLRSSRRRCRRRRDSPRAAGAENRRHSVRMMEAVLSRAVLGGAEQLAEQLGNGSPNMSFFTGQARAHGFVLDGYGVFFHVEIPEMQQSLVMSVTTLERDMAVGGHAGVAAPRGGRGARGRVETAGGGSVEAARAAGRADAGRSPTRGASRAAT